MQKGLIRKGLAFSVIVLFIFVGVQPIFAEESITSTLDKDEDCIECREINNTQLFKLKIQLTRLEVASKLLQVLSKNNPEIIDEYEIFSNDITTLKEVYNSLKDDSPLFNRPICDYLWERKTYYNDLNLHYTLLFVEFKDENSLLALFYWGFALSYGFTALMLHYTYRQLLCHYFEY